jgi:hypothetical protein
MLSTRASFILDCAGPLAGAALELLVEALGIEGVGGSGNAGQNRKSDDSGQDGLHDRSPDFSWVVQSLCTTCEMVSLPLGMPIELELVLEVDAGNVH